MNLFPLLAQDGRKLLAQDGRELLASFGPRPIADTIYDPFGVPRACLLVIRWAAPSPGVKRLQVPDTGALVVALPPGRYAVKYTGWRHIGRWLVPPPTGAPVGLDVVQLAYKEWWQK